VPSIVTTSKNPTTLLLPRYSLMTGFTYRFVVTVTVATGDFASSLVSAYVQHNSISATISGGLTQTPSVREPYTLDASNSFDKDINPLLTQSRDALKFKWSCFVTSANNYGTDCQYIFANATDLISPTVTVSNVTFGIQYTVTVLVSSDDGRSTPATVILNPIPDGVANIAIFSNLKQVNYNSQLILFASVKARASQSLAWSIVGSTLNLGNSNPMFL